MSHHLVWKLFVLLMTALSISTLAVPVNENDAVVEVIRNITSKIVGGSPVSKGVYPSFAHTIDPGCGASLIHPDILLSAAHCARAFSVGSQIAVGSTLSDGSDATEIFNVVSTYQHPWRDARYYTYDIMLVKISNFSTAPLLKINRNSTKPLDGARLKIMGFGRTEYEGTYC
jgi:secreted trypsin-like serine protease